MADLFKFRCFQCHKLLGVSPRKSGHTIQCPRCQTELVVPATDEGVQPEDLSSEADAASFSGLGIDLGFDSTLDIRTPERASVPGGYRSADEVEAIAFLEKVSIQDDPLPISASEHDEVEASGEPEPTPLVEPPLEPLVSGSQRSRRGSGSEDRRRDVVLPRTAAVAWALFALVSLALSFVSGLLIGHYRWR